MSQRDRPPIDVDALAQNSAIPTEYPGVGQDLGGECLVELEQVDVGRRKTGSGERALDRERWRGEKVAWLGGNAGVPHNPSQNPPSIARGRLSFPLHRP